jgi:DNA-binding LacI/PurR family transcriptional regulator
VQYPFAEELAMSVVVEAGRHGHFVIFLPPIREHSDAPARGQHHPTAWAELASAPIDGIIALGDVAVDQACRFHQERGMPVVCVGDVSALGQLPAVGFVATDEAHGSSLVARHLLARGHRRIAVLLGPGGTDFWGPRQAAFVREVGDQAEVELVISDVWSAEAAYQAMRSYLAEPRTITALYAHTDLMAMAAMRAIAEAGRRIPDDIAVVGFGNHRLSVYSNPPLTTVHASWVALGQQAVTLLLSMAHEQQGVPTRIMQPTELLVRASS